MTAFQESGPYSIFKQCADEILHCIIRQTSLHLKRRKTAVHILMALDETPNMKGLERW